MCNVATCICQCVRSDRMWPPIIAAFGYEVLIDGGCFVQELSFAPLGKDAVAAPDDTVYRRENPTLCVVRSDLLADAWWNVFLAYVKRH